VYFKQRKVIYVFKTPSYVKPVFLPVSMVTTSRRHIKKRSCRRRGGVGEHVLRTERMLPLK
jgi:hypothetical protein